MQIGIQMISLDDEQYIGDALESLAYLNPAYVAIADGGSTDRTIKIIDQYQEHLNILLETIPWDNDFARQRNNALGLAPPVDWFMRLDTDEVITEPMYAVMHQALSLLPSSCLAVRVKQVNLYPDLSHYAANLGGWETHPRIFKGSLRGTWVGQVHECLHNMTQDGLKPIPEQLIWDWNVSVKHSGWLDRGRRKDREKLYAKMPGSGIGIGDLTINRHYEIRSIPAQVDHIGEME